MTFFTRFQNLWLNTSEAPIKNKYSAMLFFMGVIALFAYAFAREFSHPLAKIAEPIMLLSGFVLLILHSSLRRSWWSLLFLICVFVQLISWASAMLSHPEWSSSAPTLDRLGKLFFFMPVAYLIGGSKRNTLWVWFAYGMGLILTVLTFSGGFIYWQQAFSGARADFGMQNAQHTAMYFGVLLLMLITLVKSWIFSGNRVVVWRAVLWACSVIFSLVMIYITKTRAVLIGLMLAVSAIGVTIFISKLRLGCSTREKWVAIPMILFVIALIVAGGHKISERMQPERETTDLVLQGKLHDIPYSSIGIRVQTWLVALERIKERPLLGWGDKARNQVIKQSTTLPEDIKQNYGHLHNYFIETQLSYGLLGSLFLLAYVVSFVVQIYRGWVNNIIDSDLALFGLAFLVYWVFVNNFESYLSFSSGVFVFALVVGGMQTQLCRSYHQKQKDSFI